jgi:glycosyltransferase involved in cell wall biosynthesis
MQLARPLWEDGHEVLILALRTAGCYPEDAPPDITTRPAPTAMVRNLDYKMFTDPSVTRAILASFRPDAIVSAGSLLPASIATNHVDIAPVWADLFGDALSEIQSKAGVYGAVKTRDEIFHAWKMLTSILVRADRFSALSERQRLATIGQLALAGRLNGENDGVELTAMIPCGVDERQKPSRPSRQEAAARLGIPELARGDAFVALWAGSYNTWIDGKTLFEGIDRAMDREPRLRYLSAGGGTAGYNPRIYEDFIARVETSKHRARYHLADWVPFHAMPDYYAASDIGLNVDRFTYEGMLGSRNRVIQFLAGGLPVLTTPLCELVAILAAEGHLRTFQIGDAEAFAAQLLRTVGERATLSDEVASASEYVMREFGFGATTAALRAWASKPVRAADNEALLKSGSPLVGAREYATLPQRHMDSESFLPWLVNLQSNQPQGLSGRISKLEKKLRGK